LFRNSCWETNCGPATGLFPYDSNKQELGVLSLENYCMRRIVSGLDSLIEVSIPQMHRKEKWIRGLSHYRSAIQLLRQQTDLSDEGVKHFQKDISSLESGYDELCSSPCLRACF
jgi:hypothetical protein